jgi:hypothetical protein
MYNPFLFPTKTERPRRLTVATEEAIAQLHGRSVDSNGHADAGLWLGRLLIRIGEKLARQDIELGHLKGHA